MKKRGKRLSNLAIYMYIYTYVDKDARTMKEKDRERERRRVLRFLSDHTEFASRRRIIDSSSQREKRWSGTKNFDHF